MDVVFANPLGFFALSGLPVVLLLHMLKVQPRTHPISTLFLFEHMAAQSEAGRRIDRLKSSIALWLQLLAVLLITWLLVQPRFMMEARQQRIVVVLDASASMAAFTPEIHTALTLRSERLAALAPTTEWVLLESTGRDGRLYRGEDRAAMLEAARRFSPRAGAHDYADTLRLARQLLVESGVVLFVTDHAFEAPTGVTTLAIGRPVNNVGFTGLRADATTWSALVKNHSDAPAERTWWIAEDPTHPRTKIELGPRESRVLRGPFVDRALGLTLRLEDDAFTLDDVLTIVRPKEKRLRVGIAENVGAKAMAARLLNAMPQIEQTSGEADAIFLSLPWNGVIDPSRPSIVFLDAPSQTIRRARTGAFEVGHPLSEALEWRGLSYRPDKTFKPKEGDIPILVDEITAPIVFLRGHALVVAFDPRRSNAARWPSFIVLLSRHLEQARTHLVAFEQKNVETSQSMTIATAPETTALTIVRDDQRRPLPMEGAQTTFSAPREPGFFEIIDPSGTVLARHAARFADVREADLTRASSADGLLDIEHTLALKNRSDDPLREVWSFLLLGTMLCSFFYAKGRRG